MCVFETWITCIQRCSVTICHTQKRPRIVDSDHLYLLSIEQGKDDTGKAIQDYWKPSLGLLADKDLIARLKSYDKDNIPPK